MREKSIREKLGKIFGKWIVITLLAGILVPVAPREVKADSPIATANYTPNGALDVTITGTFDPSGNYKIDVEITDSSALSKKITVTGVPDTQDASKLMKSWNRDKLALEIEKFSDLNSITYPLKINSVKVTESGGSVSSCSLSATVQPINYTKVDSIKLGNGTIITDLKVCTEEPVDLSKATIDPSDATAKGNTIEWSGIIGNYKIEDNSKIIATGTIGDAGTVNYSIVDGIFYGVPKKETVNINSIKGCTKLDKSYFIMPSNKDIDFSAQFPSNKVVGTENYVVKYEPVTEGMTITENKKAKAATAGNYTVNARIINGKGTGNDANYPITFYVDPITITKPTTDVFIGTEVELTCTLPSELSGEVNKIKWFVDGQAAGTGLSSKFTASGTKGTTHKITAKLEEYGVEVNKSIKTIDTIDIDITGSVDTVTKGYKVTFTAETPVDCTFTWKTSKSAESKKVEDGTSSIPSTSSIFSFKPTSTGTYNITCTAKYNNHSYEMTLRNALTVRRPPEISYDKSNRKITIFLPEDIEIGDSETDDVELYSIDGYKLEYEFDGTKKSKTVENLDIGESGKTVTISETDVKSYVKDVIDGKSFNEKKVKFKLIPRSGEDESKLNPTCEANVSKITVTADSSNSAAFSTQTYYGLEGVSQSITATPNSGYTFLKWSDGNTSKTRTVNFGEKASTYYAISKEGATPTPGPGTTVPKAGGAAGDGLDSVPKTAQNMVPFFMIMLAAFAAAAVVFVLVKNSMGQPAGSNIPESLKLLDFSSKNDKDKK